jgi:Na+-driven multidrug efflux pump
MGRFGFSLAMGLTAALLAILGITVAICFSCLSLYFYLATITTSALAALGVAGAALLLAIVAALSISLIRRPRPGALLPRKDEERLAEALKLGKALGGEGRDFVQSHLSRAAFAAFGVGLAMGLSPKLRKAILDLLAG